MLHILIKSPFDTDINLLLSMIRISDDLLFLQDSVISVIKNNIFLEKFLKCPAKLYVLKNDVYARGIKNKISKKIKLINYYEFVKLTIKHSKSISW
ncbi:sulfurtransferase complex subunit TusB [Buchnera aphidicola (Taiwanaphis decaspermi)]|uniref:sulfurtransferase complex subunit TusB n=1 Tax=Buchnera aphidicola TaxID=9 RepID=UPI0031B85532